jgi:hypothetical protein
VDRKQDIGVTSPILAIRASSRPHRSARSAFQARANTTGCASGGIRSPADTAICQNQILLKNQPPPTFWPFGGSAEPARAALGASLFADTDRYRLFAKLVYPQLIKARPQLAKAYSPDTGRKAIEPVLLLGVSLLQFLDGVPDRQAPGTVVEAILAPGEPTRNFITGIATQPAHGSDEAGAEQMAKEQAALGLEPPPVQYVDGAYISGEKLSEAAKAGRELIGPAQPAPQRRQNAFTTEDFRVRVEALQATCSADQLSDQCSRLAGEASERVQFRLEWNQGTCADCALRDRCLGSGQQHKTIVVGEFHSALQARRLEQKSEAFRQRMHHRNAIEGTQSELLRAHGLRRARYRGLGKAALQNHLIGAACNVKRWIRRVAWELGQASAARLEGATDQAVN